MSSRERYRLRKLRLSQEAEKNKLQSSTLSTSESSELRDEILEAVSRVRKRRLLLTQKGDND